MWKETMGPPPKTQKMYEHGMSVNNSEKNTYQRTAKRVSTKRVNCAIYYMLQDIRKVTHCKSTINHTLDENPRGH